MMKNGLLLPALGMLTSLLMFSAVSINYGGIPFVEQSEMKKTVYSKLTQKKEKDDKQSSLLTIEPNVGQVELLQANSSLKK